MYLCEIFGGLCWGRGWGSPLCSSCCEKYVASLTSSNLYSALLQPMLTHWLGHRGAGITRPPPAPRPHHTYIQPGHAGQAALWPHPSLLGHIPPVLSSSAQVGTSAYQKSDCRMRCQFPLLGGSPTLHEPSS